MIRYMLHILDYILRVLIAADITLNVVLGGKLGETLSASAWLGEQQGKIIPCIMRPVIDFLFWPIERNHCAKAFHSKLNYTQRSKP